MLFDDAAAAVTGNLRTDGGRSRHQSLRNRADVSCSWPDQLIIRVLLNGVGDPADRTSQGKYGDGRFRRQAETAGEQSQSKIQIWIFAGEHVRRLN